MKSKNGTRRPKKKRKKRSKEEEVDAKEEQMKKQNQNKRRNKRKNKSTRIKTKSNIQMHKDMKRKQKHKHDTKVVGDDKYSSKPKNQLLSQIPTPIIILGNNHSFQWMVHWWVHRVTYNPRHHCS
jgi:hypothetical protein